MSDFQSANPFATFDANQAGLSMTFGDNFVLSDGEGPIVLTGEDLRRFKFRASQAVAKALQEMSTLHDQWKQDRKVFKTIAREPIYEGGPDITTPLSSDFATGLLAHLKDAVDQNPVATFTPEGIGKQGEEASAVAPIYTAIVEREIKRSGSRLLITSDIPHELAAIGNAIVKFGVAKHGKELFIQTSRLIRAENFFVDRVSVDNLDHVTCGFKFKERFYNLLDQADDDLLDKDALEELRVAGQGDEQQVEEEHEDDFDETALFQEENTLHTLYQFYMRYRPMGEDRSRIFEFILHQPTDTYLAIRHNPVEEVYDSPPLDIVRIGREPGHLFGRGIPRRLEPQQKIADNAVNTHIAINNSAAAPPILYNANNPIAMKLAENRVLAPNMWIPNYGPPNTADIMPIQLPNNGLAINDYSIALQMAQRATFTEQSLGQPTTTRKTLGQFRTEVQKGTIKLRLDLGEMAVDMARILQKYWAMIVAFKIIPAGVFLAEPAGKLVADQEMSLQELLPRFQQTLQQFALSGRITPQEAQQAGVSLQNMMTDGRIPSAKRLDLSISLTGTKIIADKISEFDMEFKLMPVMLNLLEGARQDNFLNYWGRSILRKAGFTDIDKRWPAEPANVPQLAPEQRQALLQPMNELVQRSSLQ